MNSQTVYLKSDKGREELSTRRYGLPPRLRALLVQVDGRHSAQELAERNGGVDTYDRLQQLIDGAYIVAAESTVKAAPGIVPRPAGL
ncbi:hypothetical protein [Sinimarinibacterium thermocellulolyticum]|uniref:Transcriptional regulator n=1 Tax=Sinimarinibacterium thermocellulolyticum TaxID=3170016 RepID=A0ABV2AA58_9GAMM